MTTSTPNILELDRYLDDTKYFCEKVIVIEDRNRNPIPFIYNPAQEILHGALTGRDIVVKAGQMGITTLFLARYFHDTITKSGTTSVVVAHEEFLTTRLLNRTKIWYDNIPEYQEFHDGMKTIRIKKQRMKYDSANQKTFPDIHSTFYIGTARAFVFGRGEPIHNFLASEVAFWPDVDRILDPTLQRVPLEGTVVLESTPNGEGGRFYEIVQEAREGKGRFTLHVLPWWLEPVYRIPINSPYVKEFLRGKITDFTADELSLIKLNKWDDFEADERIRWRRLKITEIQNRFWQEFYEDIISCFLSTGTVYYDEQELNRLRKSCYPAPEYLELEDGGRAEIWYQPDDPEDRTVYHIAVDPGQGKVTQSVATVWRIKYDEEATITLVAKIAGLYDPQTFAPMVKELGYYYQDARIAPERNGHGMAFCADVSDYPNLYYQKDIISEKETRVIGWQTTGAAKLGGGGTKPYMMSELNHILPRMICADIVLIQELGFVRIAANRTLEFLGPDDHHDSAAIMAATISGGGNDNIGFAFSKGRR